MGLRKICNVRMDLIGSAHGYSTSSGTRDKCNDVQYNPIIDTGQRRSLGASLLVADWHTGAKEVPTATNLGGAKNEKRHGGHWECDVKFRVALPAVAQIYRSMCPVGSV